jgi:S-adenosylmethionine:tRNA ribosyltransferase-isomerase
MSALALAEGPRPSRRSLGAPAPRASLAPVPAPLEPARWPRADRASGRLLVVQADGALRDRTVRALPEELQAGDLLVVNDAATLPGSVRGRTDRGEPIEVRLSSELVPGTFRAVLFGAGDWRTPTEARAPAPAVEPGDRLELGDELRATVTAVSFLSTRLVDLRFDVARDALWPALYRAGAPVQYAYLRGPLEAWHVQTAYASRPWAAEMPSAGRHFDWSLLAALRQRGVRLASLTHAAGLSATGDQAIDAALPFPERWEIGPRSTAAIADTRARRGRIIAVGTSVVRALESAAAADGTVRAGSGVTSLRIGDGYRRRVVDGLLTGMHEPTGSHFDLCAAFVARPLLLAAHAQARSLGYLGHEFGDASLLTAERETP